jgi:hypothetical protein
MRATQAGALLIDMATGRCWQLNRVGAAFLTEIDGSNILGDVLDTLGQRYKVERDVLERDLLNLTQQLLDAGLIERTGP